ncbi:hypothetical protein NQT62_11135 [Limnobacter humi]|uniref:Uncharacterized protein n=1 Tax=Limnobacter humi TaxID=1778671 RepID=A0ABT1WHJ3_9BURK|nr:hypothetical protein [Limnobacter humi]MCQ8896986.1 hypothetical protein [Limnobacter humi]
MARANPQLLTRLKQSLNADPPETGVEARNTQLTHFIESIVKEPLKTAPDRPWTDTQSSLMKEAVDNVLTSTGTSLSACLNPDRSLTALGERIALDCKLEFARMLVECNNRNFQKLGFNNACEFNCPGLANYDRETCRAYVKSVHDTLFINASNPPKTRLERLEDALLSKFKFAAPLDERNLRAWLGNKLASADVITPRGLAELFKNLNEAIWGRLNNHERSEPAIIPEKTEQLRKLINSYKKTNDSRFSEAEIRRVLPQLSLRFLRAELSTDAHLKHEFAFALMAKLMNPDELKGFSPEHLNGYTLKAPEVGLRLMAGLPVARALPANDTIPSAYRKREQPVQLPRFSASVLNMKNDFARQGRFRVYTNQAMQAMEALTIAEHTKPDWGIDKRARTIARALRDSAFVWDNTANDDQVKLKVNNSVDWSSPLRNDHKKFVDHVYRFATAPALNPDQQPQSKEQQEFNTQLTQASNDLFQAKFVQAGFSARKFDRATKANQGLYSKGLKINRPARRWLGAETASLQFHKNWSARIIRYIASWWSYGMPNSVSGRPSANAARLRMMEETSDALLARMIRKSAGDVLAANTAEVKTALENNLGFADGNKEWTYGELAEVGKLVFVAARDDVLTAKLTVDQLRFFDLHNATGTEKEKLSAGGLLSTQLIKFAHLSNNPRQPLPSVDEIKNFKKLLTFVVAHSAVKEPNLTHLADNPAPANVAVTRPVGANPPVVVDNRNRNRVGSAGHPSRPRSMATVARRTAQSEGTLLSDFFPAESRSGQKTRMYGEGGILLDEHAYKGIERYVLTRSTAGGEALSVGKLKICLDSILGHPELIGQSKNKYYKAAESSFLNKVCDILSDREKINNVVEPLASDLWFDNGSARQETENLSKLKVTREFFIRELAKLDSNHSRFTAAYAEHYVGMLSSRNQEDFDQKFEEVKAIYRQLNPKPVQNPA